MLIQLEETDGQLCYIDPEGIVSIQRVIEHNYKNYPPQYTIVRMLYDWSILVKETPQVIQNAIRDT